MANGFSPRQFRADPAREILSGDLAIPIRRFRMSRPPRPAGLLGIVE